MPYKILSNRHMEGGTSGLSNEGPKARHWSEAAVIQQDETYGNYVVASRLIQEGELLLKEYPLTVSTYGTSDEIPCCLTCGKAVKLLDRCSKCNWPMCNAICEEESIHSKRECPIFVKNQLGPLMNTRSEYSAVEVIRILHLRHEDPSKWERFLSFESHCDNRKSDPTANALTKFIIDFIRNKCKLEEYDEDTLEKLIGVFAINTFWLKDTGRYLSLVFDKVTLLTHDCEPNTKRVIVPNYFLDESGNKKYYHFILIISSRVIQPGEPLTIYYTALKEPVEVRQKYLSTHFYFSCKCNRCLRELTQELTIDNNKNVDAI